MTGRRGPASLLVAVLLAALLWWVQGGDPAPEAADTVDLIDAGGPWPHDQDDETFFNREGLLPDEPEGFYREYTVPTPGSADRGAAHRPGRLTP